MKPNVKNIKWIRLSLLTILCIIGIIAIIASGTTDEEEDSAGSGSGSISGIVRDMQGSTLSGVTVASGDTNTTTSSNGTFTINGIGATTRCTVNFTKSGYVFTTQITRVRKNLDSYIEARMAKQESSGSFESDTGGTVTSSSGASVTTSADSLVDSSGNAYSGTVSVSLTNFDPTTTAGLEAFPGEFEGVELDGDTIPILSYGFMDVTLKDDQGNPLQLASGKTAEITIPIPTGLTSSAPSTMPIWYFNTTDGKWHEETTGTKSGNAYKATITHFSMWNNDVGYSRSYVTGRILDCNGKAVEGAKVTIHGISPRNCWTSGERSTSSDGYFPSGDDARWPGVPVDANSVCEISVSKGGVTSTPIRFTALGSEQVLNLGTIYLGTQSDPNCENASEDNDGDGYSVAQGDCNDSDASINPGALEIPNDGIDQDCNGSDSSISTESLSGGTYYVTSKNRYTESEWHMTTTLNSGGTFDNKEYLNNMDPFEYSGSWSYNSSSRYFDMSVTNGGDMGGTISGSTANFWVDGHWADGESDQFHWVKQ